MRTNTPYFEQLTVDATKGFGLPNPAVAGEAAAVAALITIADAAIFWRIDNGDPTTGGHSAAPGDALRLFNQSEIQRFRCCAQTASSPVLSITYYRDVEQAYNATVEPSSIGGSGGATSADLLALRGTGTPTIADTITATGLVEAAITALGGGADLATLDVSLGIVDTSIQSVLTEMLTSNVNWTDMLAAFSSMVAGYDFADIISAMSNVSSDISAFANGYTFDDVFTEISSAATTISGSNTLTDVVGDLTTIITNTGDTVTAIGVLGGGSSLSTLESSVDAILGSGDTLTTVVSGLADVVSAVEALQGAGDKTTDDLYDQLVLIVADLDSVIAAEDAAAPASVLQIGGRYDATPREGDSGDLMALATNIAGYLLTGGFNPSLNAVDNYDVAPAALEPLDHTDHSAITKTATGVGIATGNYARKTVLAALTGGAAGGTVQVQVQASHLGSYAATDLYELYNETFVLGNDEQRNIAFICNDHYENIRTVITITTSTVTVRITGRGL